MENSASGVGSYAERVFDFVTAASAAFDTDDLSGALRAVTRIAVESKVAAVAVCYLRGRDGRLEPVGVNAVDDALAAETSSIVRRYPLLESFLHERSPRGAPVVLAPFDAQAVAHNAEHQAQVIALGLTSYIALPLRARGETQGVLSLARCGASPAFDELERRVFAVLAERGGAAIETSRALARERRIAETFQRAALPRSLPDVPGIALDALYAPAEDADVGGDWYDAFTLDDGRLFLSIGDVAGKNLEAAVVMSTVRQSIRVAAYRGDDLGEVLAVADASLRRESPDRFATAFVAVVDPRTWELSWATAGHPPPIVRRPDGTAFELDHADPPLGVLREKPSVRRMIGIPAGSTLVLYTDGLIEATRNVTEGLRQLARAVSADAIVHSSWKARFVRDAVLTEGQRDDVAILVVTLGRPVHWAFDATDAVAAHGARWSFLQLLRERAHEESDFGSAELIFGELIGNVMRYAPGPIEIDLAWDDPRPVLHVMDRGPGFEYRAEMPEDPLAESGRGLFIVATLGDDLRVERLPGRGSHVRVRLPVVRSG